MSAIVIGVIQLALVAGPRPLVYFEENSPRGQVDLRVVYPDGKTAAAGALVHLLTEVDRVYIHGGRTDPLGRIRFIGVNYNTVIVAFPEATPYREHTLRLSWQPTELTLGSRLPYRPPESTYSMPVTTYRYVCETPAIVCQPYDPCGLYQPYYRCCWFEYPVPCCPTPSALAEPVSETDGAPSSPPRESRKSDASIHRTSYREKRTHGLSTDGWRASTPDHPAGTLVSSGEDNRALTPVAQGN